MLACVYVFFVAFKKNMCLSQMVYVSAPPGAGAGIVCDADQPTNNYIRKPNKR